MPDGSQKNRFGRGHDWTDLGLSKRAEFVDKTLMKAFSLRDCKATRILYHSTYKKASVYLHGMWASLARSLEPGANAAAADGEVEVGIRIKDKNPQIAAQALNAANVAATTMLLFAGKFFERKKYLDWVISFKGPYVEALKEATRGL